LIERAGPSGKPILIQGETGTGKELVARALHACSPIATKPLVTINCAALPESLLESELFGHERGSFTGAVAAKSGLFEVADGGTLFIDEMGEMPGGLQAKLLRVLEDGSMRRVGSVKERRVNVRLLAATNKDLAKETREGRFREDLYYRINVMCLQLPPLRERVGDIPLLVNHFLGPGWTISPEAMKVLEQYSWPGNVRQLINAIERAKILADEREVYLEDFPHEVVRGERDSHPDGMSLAETDDLTSLQRAKIIEVMTEENGNKARAARRLGISRRSLYRALERFEIS
jgi:transcriptional regulator with GAF, ATPase, and Fis domain